MSTAHTPRYAFSTNSLGLGGGLKVHGRQYKVGLHTFVAFQTRRFNMAAKNLAYCNTVQFLQNILVRHNVTIYDPFPPRIAILNV